MQRAGFVTLPAVPPNPAVQLHQGDLANTLARIAPWPATWQKHP